MNVGDNLLYRNPICAGCLSLERKLTQLNQPELMTIFCELIQSFDRTSTILLCWECSAIVKRFIQFRERVKLASGRLLQCVIKKSKPLPLSNLKITNTTLIDCTTNINNTKKDSNLILALENQNHCDLENVEKIAHIPEAQNSNQYNLIKNPCNSDQKESHKSLENGDELPYFLNESRNRVDRKTQSVCESDIFTFIKVEDDYIDALGDENLHQNDGCDSYDEKDIKNFFKIEPRIELSSTTTDIKLNNNTDKEDFNESDDEPLNFKKKRKKEPVKKVKRKDITCNDKLDRRRTRKGKREQQPGVVRHPRVERILQQLNVDPEQMEMVILGWDEIEAERQKALQNVAYIRHKYKCKDCIIGFNHRFKLDNHMKKHDQCSGDVVCSVCRIRCKDECALRAHKRRHRVRWRCCVCGDLSSRAPVAADHVARAHGAPPPVHTCKLCGHKESSLGKLRSHMKNHAERPKCDLCEKTFRDRASLRTHLFIHRGEKEYSCPRCGKRFLFKKAMEVHMVTHDASAHLYCHLCDVNFKNRMSFNQHMKYNLKHIDPSKLKYACELCGKKFAKKKRLEEHNVAVHLNEKPINCTVQGCTFACSSRPVLRTHVRMVHRNARAQRNHVCHTCGKTYTTKKSLEGHMRSHSGERPFRCVLCASAFGYKAALYNHNKLVHHQTKTGRNYTQQSKETPEKPNEII